MRLSVAVAPHPPRLQALLGAYVEGPGRQLFVPAPVEHADTLIADYDHAPARAAMQRFRAEQQRPCIVLAQHDPKLPDAVWVAKPVSFVGLAQAAATIHRWREHAAAAADPAAPGAPVPPPGLQAARPGLPAPQPGLPSAAPRQSMPTQAAAMPLASGVPPTRPGVPDVPVAAEAPAPRPSPLRGSPARFVSATREVHPGKPAWLAIGMVGILLVAAALGWQPASEDARRLAGTAEDDGTALRQAHEAALRWAVQASLRDYRMRSEADQRELAYHLERVQALQQERGAGRSDARPARAASGPRNRVVVMGVGTGVLQDPSVYDRLNLKAAVALSAPGGRGPSDAALADAATRLAVPLATGPRAMPVATTGVAEPRPSVASGCDFMLDGRCMTLATRRPGE